MLSIYQEYVRNHHYSVQVLTECKQSTAFSTILYKLENKPACHSCQLDTFLMTPMHQVILFANPRIFVSIDRNNNRARDNDDNGDYNRRWRVVAWVGVPNQPSRHRTSCPGITLLKVCFGTRGNALRLATAVCPQYLLPQVSLSYTYVSTVPGPSSWAA